MVHQENLLFTSEIRKNKRIGKDMLRQKGLLGSQFRKRHSMEYSAWIQNIEPESHQPGRLFHSILRKQFGRWGNTCCYFSG